MSATENSCPVPMSDEEPCGRPIYSAPKLGTDNPPVCLMHSKDTSKDAAGIEEEIDAILNGTSKHHRPKEKLDFQGFVFLKLLFTKKTFDKPVNFKGIEVILEADFGEAHFNRDADFTGAIFRQDVRFTLATFHEDAEFSEAHFESNANFGKTTYVGEGKFSGTIFDGDTYFDDAKFDKIAYFQVARFRSRASFWKATFRLEAVFIRTTFRHNAEFGSATFSKAALFVAGECGNVASFSRATFAEEANFSEVTFKREARFRWAGFAGIATFRSARFEQPDMAKFYQVNKSHPTGFRARFVNCDVKEVAFVDVHWHRQRGRMVLQDELDVIAAKTDKKETSKKKEVAAESRHELVAITYRQLVTNFEKVRASDLAEDCYVGAMEMERRKPKMSFSEWLVRTSYWCASYHGSSYKRAFGVLGLMLLVFSMTFFFSGFKEANPESTPIEYNLFHDSVYRPAPIGRILEDSARAVVFTFSVATFQRTRFYEPVGLGSQALVVVATLFMTTQIALIILALRRRFKR